MRTRGWIFGLLMVAVLASLAYPPWRQKIRAAVPSLWIVHLQGLWHGFSIDHGVRIPMADGVTLAASLYLPTNSPSAPQKDVATIFVRGPYGRRQYDEGLTIASYFARRGFAVLVQDIRGKGDSGGEFVPYRHATQDGATTLDWIVRQPWSNGRIGTMGCSALGELQHILARARHPAHRAMVPMAAGGAAGSLQGRYGYFGLYEGGIFQLASGFGWFLDHGAPTPAAAAAATIATGKIDIAAALRTLPLRDMMQRARPGPNAFDEFVRRPLTDPWWAGLDYIADADRFSVPSLVINTWGDQTIGETLALAEAQRASAPPALAKHQHVVIAPGIHCQHGEDAESGRFGDIEINNANQPYFAWYRRWFEYWLYDRGDALTELPAYLYYQIGEHRWLSADAWPPKETTLQRWQLGSGGSANGRDGNGVLSLSDASGAKAGAKAGAEYDEFRDDPADPVPSRGGPICCTGNRYDRAGPVDQRDVETRKDVLVYTSAALKTPLRIAGPLKARLFVSSSARDTDIVARLVHVRPDGLATNIQEGALRLRYRNGIERPQLLTPNEPVEVTVDMRSIAYTLPAGHRLRLTLSGSSFPRLARNLNTGGGNFDEATGVVAVNRVFYGRNGYAFVEVAVLPE